MIDKYINNLIMKNNVDEYYPLFRKSIEAKSIIKEIIKKWIGRKVLCICTSEICKKYFEKNTVETKGLHIIYKVTEKADCYDTNNILFDSDIELSDFDEIWNLGKKGSFFVNNYFRHAGYKIFNLYDEFDKRNILFENEWYSLFQHNTGGFTSRNIENVNRWCDYSITEYLDLKYKYNSSSDRDSQIIYLKKMLFISLYIKDFSESYRILDLLYNFDTRYGAIKSELSDIIENIKRMIGDRQKRDILVFWIDKVPHSDFSKLSNLYEFCSQNAINFSNFYTMNPYTMPSFAQMFAGMKPIDDGGCFASLDDIENGCFIKQMEGMGYKICYVSPDFEKCLLPYHCSTSFHDVFSPSSEILWDCIRNLVNSDKPVFIVGQLQIEGHEPSMSIGIKNILDRNSRYRECIKYLDDQVCFYNKLLSDSVTRVFMSDHGKDDFRSRFHIIMSVYSNRIKSGTNDSLYSLLNFSDLIFSLSNDNFDAFTQKETEYIQVQDYNHMSGFDIGVAIKNRGRIDQLIRGYRGVITKEHIYLKFSSGNEWFSENNEECLRPFEPTWYMREDDMIGCPDPDTLARYRKLAGEHEVTKEEVEEREKYNKYVWEIFKKAFSKNKDKLNIINKLFYELPDDGLAIRFGGYHTMGLISVLSEQNKKKIKCIIDNDKECLCKKIGIPIETTIPEYINVVIISSKRHMDEIVDDREFRTRRIRYIDLYKYLEDKGISCKYYCFDFEAEYSDYDVGFPFEEFDI